MRLRHGATSSIASVELHVQSRWDLGTCSTLASPAAAKLVLNLHTCEEAMKIRKLQVKRRKSRQSWSKSQMLLRRAPALRAVSPRSRWARVCRAQQRTRSGMVPACVVLTSFIASVARPVPIFDRRVQTLSTATAMFAGNALAQPPSADAARLKFFKVSWVCQAQHTRTEVDSKLIDKLLICPQQTLHGSGQFIATSAEVTPNGGLVRQSPQKWP